MDIMNVYCVHVGQHLAQVIGGMVTVFRSAVLLQAYRWINDSREKIKKKD